MKRPWFSFFPADWLSDSALRACDDVARSVWIDLICLMHQSPRYGYLLKANGKPWTVAEVARATSRHHHTCYKAFTTLVTMGVTSRSPEGYLYSRRMVRDEVKRDKWLKDQQNHRKRQELLSGDCQAVPIPIPNSLPLDQFSKYVDHSHNNGGCGGDSADAPEARAACEVNRKLSARQRTTGECGFDEFWSLYSRHEDKHAALLVWKNKKLEAKKDAILAGLAIWKKSDQWARGYIPYATKFLSHKLWESPPMEGETRETADERRRREKDEQTARVVAAVSARRAGGASS